MVEIRQTPMGGPIDDFLDVVDYIYRDDPAYVRPLDMELRERLNPRKNPFFQHGEGAIFCAYRNGWCVGRVTAQIDRDHLARYMDDTGFFGLLDTIDDEEVARALLSRAESWLRGKGMRRVRGPLSLNINEELGCLVEGFTTSPYFLMPHHRPYQGGLVERAGYAKAKDFYAWQYRVGDLNPRVKRAREEIRAMPEVTEPPRLDGEEPGRATSTFSSTSSTTPGATTGASSRSPARRSKKMAADFRLLLAPDLTCIVSIDGEPAAMAVALPNVNEMVRDMHGKVFPFGLPKLLWRLKVEKPKSARLILLGIRKKWRYVRKYAALSVFLYAEMNEGAKRLGFREGELGWTLEDNGRVNAGIQMMGARLYKTYRVYERAIGKEGAS